MKRPRRTDAPPVTERLVEHGWSVMVYDGYCRYCTQAVRLVAERSRGQLLAFSAMQSPAGSDTVSAHNKLAKQENTIDRATTIVLTPAGTLQRSDAILHLLTFMPTPWPAIARTLAYVPRVIRDAVYTAVDRARLVLPKRRSECMVSLPEMARRFVR